MNITRPQQWLTNNGSGNGLVPSGNKPLHEPMLTEYKLQRHCIRPDTQVSWWRHQMETFSALLAPLRGIHRSPLNSPHDCQWRWALMFCFICAWINSSVSNREAGDMRCHCVHYDVTVMFMALNTLVYNVGDKHSILFVFLSVFVVMLWCAVHILIHDHSLPGCGLYLYRSSLPSICSDRAAEQIGDMQWSAVGAAVVRRRRAKHEVPGFPGRESTRRLGHGSRLWSWWSRLWYYVVVRWDAVSVCWRRDIP